QPRWRLLAGGTGGDAIARPFDPLSFRGGQSPVLQRLGFRRERSGADAGGGEGDAGDVGEDGERIDGEDGTKRGDENGFGPMASARRRRTNRRANTGGDGAQGRARRPDGQADGIARARAGALGR